MLSRIKLRDSYLASLKMFLGTSGGITHHPPTLSTMVTFQSHPRSKQNSLPMYLCINPRCQKRLKATTTILTVWGDIHKHVSYTWEW